MDRTMEQYDQLSISESATRTDVDTYLEGARRGAAYLASARARRVFPDPSALAQLDRLRGPLPHEGEDPSLTLELLDQVGSAGTVALSGGRYFGFVNGGAVPAARAANVLAAAWDQCAAMRVLSPVGAVLEDIVLRWILEILGLPESSAGALVTGATIASFICLAAARHSILAEKGWNVEELGLFGAPEFKVFASADAHSSVLKAPAMLGLGRSRIEWLKTDDQGRVITSELPTLTERAIICIQAGNVNTGSSDNFLEVCRWAKDSRSWVHVDGAFGLWAAALCSKEHLLRGVELADSWATDGHKWLNVPYDCGIALVKSADDLKAAMSISADYLKFGAEREPAHFGPELSRRARGIEVWAALRSLGVSGVTEMLRRTCEHAEFFAKRLSDEGFQILNDVVLNQVLVSFGSDAKTQAVTAKIQEEGICWCGTTMWKGRVAMRISVCSWATTLEDVELSLASMLDAANKC